MNSLRAAQRALNGDRRGLWNRRRCDLEHQQTLDGAGQTPDEAESTCSTDRDCGGLYDKGCNGWLGAQTHTTHICDTYVLHYVALKLILMVRQLLRQWYGEQHVSASAILQTEAFLTQADDLLLGCHFFPSARWNNGRVWKIGLPTTCMDTLLQITHLHCTWRHLDLHRSVKTFVSVKNM